MNDPFSPERKTVWLKKQNLFGSGYAGLGVSPPEAVDLPLIKYGVPGTLNRTNIGTVRDDKYVCL